MIGYEIYASSGFDNSIIENSENKTFLPAAKKTQNGLKSCQVVRHYILQRLPYVIVK
jgi:hypothetical protein